MSFDKQGHRGCRGLMPENTIPAMKKAMDLGVSTLEMDVVVSKDKKVVVSHEPWFSHMISTNPQGEYISSAEEKNYALYAMNYEEIRKWDVGMKPHVLYPRQEKIKVYKPLLEELIDSLENYAKQINAKPPKYNIETKSSPSGDNIFHPVPGEFVDLLMAVINDKGIIKRTTIQSFDVRTLQLVHQKYPSVHTSLLIEGSQKNSLEANLNKLGFRPDIYSPEYRLVTPELVNDCHARGIRIVPWTVNDIAQISRLKLMGVDGIISDYPDLYNQKQ